jgi:hypothetical protein
MCVLFLVGEFCFFRTFGWGSYRVHLLAWRHLHHGSDWHAGPHGLPPATWDDRRGSSFPASGTTADDDDALRSASNKTSKATVRRKRPGHSIFGYGPGSLSVRAIGMLARRQCIYSVYDYDPQHNGQWQFSSGNPRARRGAASESERPFFSAEFRGDAEESTQTTRCPVRTRCRDLPSVTVTWQAGEEGAAKNPFTVSVRGITFRTSVL